MITREVDYAIRALLFLSRKEDGPVTSTTVLAEEMDIPYRFLRRILFTLGAAGMVESRRGAQGGLRLARPAAGISLYDIVHAMNPDAVTLNLCLSDPAQCRRAARCVVHDELATIQAELEQRLRAITLSGLTAREREQYADV